VNKATHTSKVVLIVTTLYSAVGQAVPVPAAGCRMHKEAALMRRANRRPVSRRRLLTLLAKLAVVFALVVLAAVMGWVGTNLIPLAVLLGMGVVVLWLLVQLVKGLPRGRDFSDWWQ
jgi:hypothetical protein